MILKSLCYDLFQFDPKEMEFKKIGVALCKDSAQKWVDEEPHFRTWHEKVYTK